MYKHTDDVVDGDGFNFNIYSQLKRKDEIDSYLINNLSDYIKILRIDFDPEENFLEFKNRILAEFSDNENFSCNKEYKESK